MSGPNENGRISILLILVPVALVLSAYSCGHPAASPAGGEIGGEVEAALEEGEGGFDHSEWNTILAESVHDGLLDYEAVRNRRDLLDRYLVRVAGADIESLSPDHLKAFLANAYNAYTVLAILEHPEVSSIRDIPNVWTEERYVVGGHTVSLDGIEHNMLRPYFRDPRIHFAINCASRSCAPLRPFAWNGETIDADLDEAARTFLSSARNVRVEGERLLLSSYFDWFEEDFTTEGWRDAAPTASAYIARFATPEVRDFIERHHGDPPVSYIEYDWSLNEYRPTGGPGEGPEGIDRTSLSMYISI